MARKPRKPGSPAPRRKAATLPPASEAAGGAGYVPPFPVVGIGASAGGLNAYIELLRALPADTGMAYVLVQHMDPTHHSMLSEILARECRMPVTEVKDHTRIERDRVYVIPAATNITIVHGVLELSPRREPRGQHRPIDHFLRSLAEDQGFMAVGVILSGTGSDGTLGLQEVKAAGGITFAQDGTAEHDSMPGSAIAAGCVDYVLPPDGIAREIARVGAHPYVLRGVDAAEMVAAEPDLKPVLEALHAGAGMDFSQYKRNTLYRRIARRMVLHKIQQLPDYVKMLQSDSGEVEALYQDVLISVTSFFRNPEAFEVLKTKVFPKITGDRSRTDAVRMWVLGCSTGEEAYSIAIAFAEYGDEQGRSIPFQIFASDLNAAGIEKARAGVYSKAIEQDVTPARLRRYFVETEGGYRVAKPIREACVFARHNVLTEPPFSRIDLISCRNMLIYLTPEIQQKVIPTLHYSLRPNGVLWLGTSEALGSYRNLFELDETRHKIYHKKPAPVRLPIPVTARAPAAYAGVRARHELAGEPVQDSRNTQKEADRLLLARFAPPSVIVSRDLEILQFRGDTGPYLAPAPGRASLNLLKMLREGLVVGVRAALQEATKDASVVRREGLRVKSNGGYRHVDIEIIPIQGNGEGSGGFLLLFHDAAGRVLDRPPAAARGVEADATARASPLQEIEQLNQEVTATRDYLQAVIEQQEAANEELQAANEEVQSSNEELQSINEELETSKEEIQSSNEELATVNQELQNRNAELADTNNDLANLLASVQMPIVMLGANLRIRRFTPAAERLLNLIPTDVGRPVTDIKFNLSIPNLERIVEEVIDTVTVRELEVKDQQGHWFLLRIRPYRTADNRIDGAVLVMVDVDQLKRDADELRRQADLIDESYEPIVLWQLDGAIQRWNKGAEETYGYTRDEAGGRSIHELLKTSVSPDVFKEVLQREGRWSGELTQTRRDGRQVVVESVMVRVRNEAGGDLVLETNHPVTERREREQLLAERARELAAADSSKNEFLAMLAHELRNPLAPLSNAVELLDGDTDQATLEQARDVLRRQTRNLSRLIGDLLDASRIAQGKIQVHKERVELNAVIRHAIQACQHHFHDRGQTLQPVLPSEAIYLMADPLRLEQVFVNLLNNASKYSNDRGVVRLRVDRSRGHPAHAGGEVVIRVVDDGIGMHPQLVPKVFDLFTQADRTLERASGGLGIGLTLVRRLVELHGGSVEARSDGEGRGSEFIVRLPLDSATERVAESLPAAPAGTVPPRRILIVEDNEDGAETLAMVLRIENHEVYIAHHGRAALDVANEVKPHVALLDIGLPGMSGYEVAREMRRIPAMKNAMLVACSGYAPSQIGVSDAEGVFDHFLMKPIEFDQLHAVLAEQAAAERTRDSA